MKNHINVLNCIRLSCFSLGIISVIAVNADPNYKDGLKFGSESDPYWFKVNSALQLDERLFLGSKPNGLYNGASIRKFDVDLAAGLGNNLSLESGVSFEAATSKVRVNDLSLTYKGYKKFGDNFNISIGKINPSFCLENTSSSKWIPFLEKSIAVTAFSPNPGLGVGINKWQKDYSINATLTQPRPDELLKDENGTDIKQSDRLQLNLRGTKAHFFGEHKLLQAGLSGHFQDDGRVGIEFSTAPESKARYSTDMLLNTTDSSGKRIKSNSHYVLGLELLGQDGPLSAQAEGMLTKVNRDKSQAGGNVTFKGYYANINYVLTGESRVFKENQGVLGRIVPEKEDGAWELSARYSFLNLTDKNVKGGADHSVGVACTWYANYNIAVTGEWMNHRVKKSNTLEKLNFSSVGARLQLVF